EVFTVATITDNLTLTLDTAYQGATASGLTAYRDPNLLVIDNGDAVNKLTVTRSGNVGIGTAAPGYKFDVQGGTGIVGQFSGRVIGANAVNGNEFATKSQLDAVSAGACSNCVTLQSTTPGTAQTGNINVSGTILAGSSIGIGLTNPSSPLHVFKIYDTAVAAAQIGQQFRTNYNVADTGQKYGTYSVQRAAHTSGNIAELFGNATITEGTGNGGTTDNVYNVYSKINVSAGHTITNAHNLYVAAASTAGTMTNQYGLYVADLTTATNNYAVYTAGSTKSYFGGNVGIGTASPNTALDLQGVLSVRGMAAPSVSLAGQGKMYFDSTTNTFKVSQNGGGYLDMMRDATLQTAYNFSTGGTTPEIKLDSTRGGLDIQDANTTLGATTDLLAVRGSNSSGLGTVLFNVQGNGNVGIGTGGPSQKLTVQSGNILNTANSTTLTNGGALNSGDLILQGYYDSDATTAVVASARNMSLRSVISAAGSERLVVLSNAGIELASFDGANQRVGIGTSSPGARLHVVGANATGTSGANAAQTLQVTGGTGGTGASSGTPGTGGSGGLLALQGGTGGTGGDNTGGGATGAGGEGGTGSHINLTGGTGGNGGLGTSDCGGACGSTGGKGGDITLQGGAGGIGEAGALGGNGNRGHVLLQTSGGNVGIGTSAPASKLDVYNNTAISNVNIFRILSDVGSVGNVKLRVDSEGDLFLDGTITAAATTITAGAADVAEEYNVTDDAEPGDIVMAQGGVNVGKTQGSYEGAILGVVSTKPGLTLSLRDQSGAPTTANPKPIALVGRVPVKVSNENGAIAIGDPLTSSSIPGVATKATAPGVIIGRALEPFSGERGVVEVFVTTGYYNPTSGSSLQNGGDASFASLNVSGLTTLAELKVTGVATIATLKVTGSAEFAGDIKLANGAGNTRNAITKKFRASKPITQGQVVIADGANDGQVTTTTTAADNRVLGVAASDATRAGDEIEVAIGGTIQVKTGAAGVKGGDILVSAAEEGLAAVLSTPPAGSLIGKATSKIDANGLVWILVTLH
ncbi:DUF2190 family protein, partial [Candidatus Parcubacteria bacterium]|nr:DUF2190 family protein [Candidatus Parcubacteria bacterium]